MAAFDNRAFSVTAFSPGAFSFPPLDEPVIPSFSPASSGAAPLSIDQEEPIVVDITFE